MSRYFTRPRSFFVADEVWSEPMIPAITVADHEAAETGLLDHNGDPIWRAPNPMGFSKDEEW